MLVDTDVLIDYLRGNPLAEEFLETNSDTVFISSITVAELYHGVMDGDERSALDSMMSAFSVLPVTEEIAKEGGLICRQYRKTHNSSLADCLIAATARRHKIPLYSLNLKHFPMLENASRPCRKN